MEFDFSGLPGHEGRRGLYMHTYTGKKYFPCDPRPEEVCIEDIAHHLSLQNRFAGATTTAVSVAEHSLFCSQIEGTPEEQLDALMHDAAEAYLQDMIRPIKYLPQIMPIYKRLEYLNETVIAEVFGLRYPWSAHVKRCDEIAVNVEMEQRIVSAEKGYLHERMETGDYRLLDLSAKRAEGLFLIRFDDLTTQIADSRLSSVA